MICKNADEAAEIGVGYREATEEERQRFGLRALWDWNDDSPGAQSRGREQPSSTQTSRGRERTIFRPHRATHRRSAIWPTILSPRVAAAVASALHGSGGPSKPAALDDAEWQEFIAFQAWKKTKEAVADLAHEERPSGMAGAVGVEDDAGRAGGHCPERMSIRLGPPRQNGSASKLTAAGAWSA